MFAAGGLSTPRAKPESRRKQGGEGEGRTPSESIFLKTLRSEAYCVFWRSLVVSERIPAAERSMSTGLALRTKEKALRPVDFSTLTPPLRAGREGFRGGRCHGRHDRAEPYGAILRGPTGRGRQRPGSTATGQHAQTAGQGQGRARAGPRGGARARSPGGRAGSAAEGRAPAAGVLRRAGAVDGADLLDVGHGLGRDGDGLALHVDRQVAPPRRVAAEAGLVARHAEQPRLGSVGKTVANGALRRE